MPLLAEDGINLSFGLTDADFQKFSMLIGQAVYPTPVEPARGSGILHVDLGVAATVLKIDTSASYWKNSVQGDFTRSGYVGVPRLVVSKGFGKGTISGSYAQINGTKAKTYGGSLDIPIIDGGLINPALTLRAAYGTVTGVDRFSLKTYGAEAFLSKGFGPLMPYAAIGRMRVKSSGSSEATMGIVGPKLFASSKDVNRYTVGVRISMLVPKLVIEATQAEQRSYAAKVSFGF
jgi:hypothetical protein